jgi:GTP:adenosylcobinamide-phosphate guanylyltransferase
MNSTNVKTIIIQAGGRGSRMSYLTDNKPKLLIPFRGKTILQHFLDNYPDCDFIIIADYKKDVLISYINTILLDNFAKNITVIESEFKGSYAGLITAKKIITHNEPIAIVWSDLVLSSPITHAGEIQVYTTAKVECRYSFENNKIVNVSNAIEGKLRAGGVFGLFTLKNKDLIDEIEHRSFVGDFLLSNEKPKLIRKKSFKNVIDLGTLERYNNQLDKNYSRFFNLLKINRRKKTMIKTCIVPGYEHLINSEIDWYYFVSKKGFKNIPEIFCEAPLTMEYIDGLHPHEKKDFGEKDLFNIIETIAKLHSLSHSKPVVDDLKLVYLQKTIDRVNSVRPLIPFYDLEEISINNVPCVNPFHPKFLVNFIENLRDINCEHFKFIHGDTTSSNMFIKKDGSICLFDPRGIFGKSEIFGDPCYDYAKLYYSLFGNYDAINTNNFMYRASASYGSVLCSITPTIQNRSLEEKFFEYVIKHEDFSKAKNMLMQSSLWFSLTGYVVENYDAINFAFLQGCYYYTKYLKCKTLSN